MSEVKKPMRLVILLDWCEYHCPCGATYSTRYCDEQKCEKWKQDHKAHTNGKCVEMWDEKDTLRVMSSVPKDQTFDL